MLLKQKRGTRSPRDLTLLIITDERGSAGRRDQLTIRKNTTRHFARFIELLKRSELPGAILIKNVGDSLMIRVQTNRSRQSILNLLQAILEAQEELAGHGVNIRALVALLSDSNYQPVEGSSISSYLNKTLQRSGIKKKDRDKILPHKQWLKDDLFGTPVARAFRASTIPTECDLVVEDSVAKLAHNRLRSDGGVSGNLKFGPNVAFSPIRGMQDLYDVGRPQLDVYGHLESGGGKEHVWLRTVKLVNGTSPHPTVGRRQDDSLIRRQQQARVLTELVLPPTNPSIDQAILFWQRALSMIENKAEYFRFIGHPLRAITWKFEEGGEGQKENSYHAQLLVLGAYPEFDTYFNIREAIHKLNEQCAKKADKMLQYAQTTMLWSPRAPEETAPEYWRRPKPGDIFIVLMGRAHDKDRTDSLTIAGTFWHKILGNIQLYPGKPFTDIGAVMGEWDYYGIYDLESSNETWKDKLIDIEEKCQKQILPNLARLRLYVCKVP